MTRTPNKGSIVATTLAGAALTVAVIGGGAAVAGGHARDSIASRHIKDQSIRVVDLAKGSVTGAKVADGSLTGADVENDSLSGADIDEDTLDTVQLAEAAKVADSALEAGTADAAHRVLGMSRAMMRADGSLIDQEGGSIIDSEQTETPGRYLVTFVGPHLGCLVIPSVTHSGTEPVAGSASVWRKGPVQETFGRFVVVETHAPDGDGVPDPLPFGLLIVC
ncbi:hypothetical protein SFC88_00615 [Nocardioides sp. HM23]|uniref:hypothetical protein n=1 Tax=Nocardioides bizhenqiangii TaxID=3095076 RepID=UPI002ACA1965|nr:hypothetical protein [Nocardioides sp. HM23]MDZ5619305.1 hypothetical protein [Nocardioides sp. HM23]